MYELIYPTVDLFVYDLRDGLGQSDQKVEINRRKFWQKIDPTRTDLQTSKENPEKDFVKLHSQRFPEPYLDGMYLALQIGDTYFLQIDASDRTTKDEPTKDNPPRSLDQLAKLKQLVINKLNHHEKADQIDPDNLGTLGQTWLVWGQATAGNKTQDDLAKIAEACFPHLLPNRKKWKSNFTETDTKIGELAGAKVFEYTHTPKNWNADLTEFSQENYHLVIMLFPADSPPLSDIKIRMQQVSFDLVKLFAYRHKILWSYWNSRRLKAELKKDAQQMEDLRQQIQAYQNRSFDLNQLQQRLTESLPMLAEYSTKLNQMSSQEHTIDINLKNYQKRLAKIIKDQSTTPVSLTPFQEFVTIAEERYQQQIQMDHEGLSSVLTILENLTRTIDTLVNIERTKVESQQNTTIAIAGLGLAASGSVAGIVATQVRQTKDADSSDRISVGWGLAYSSVIPLLVAIILGVYWYQNHRKSNK